MSQPSHTSWNHEKNWEHVCWESHCFVNDTTVKVNVWIQFSVNEVRITQSNLLQFHCNFNQFLSSSDFEYFISDLLNDLCSWIIRFINSVSESVQKFLSVLNVFDELWNILLFANLLKHSQDSFVGTSVFWAVKCT